MTQREIDKRTGLKGRASKFMFPVSESKFSGDRVMFNDTGSVRLDYSLDNKNGLPTIDTDMISLGSANQSPSASGISIPSNPPATKHSILLSYPFFLAF